MSHSQARTNNATRREVLPLRIIISGTRVHGIAQLCSPRRPCHRLGGLQPGTALQTASKNSNVRPFHSSKGVFTAPPSEPSIAACPCSCSSPPWRCKLLCGCQRLLLSTACYGTVCHDGSAGCGNAEARHIARAAQRQLLLCDAHRRRSSSPWLLKWSCRHAVVRRDVAMSAGI